MSWAVAVFVGFLFGFGVCAIVTSGRIEDLESEAVQAFRRGVHEGRASRSTSVH